MDRSWLRLGHRRFDLADVGVDAVADDDGRHVAVPRPDFLRRWIDRPGGTSVAAVDGGALRGFAVARPCLVGHKIGPLFADDATVADALLTEIGGRMAGEPIFLDVPEVNGAAMDLVRRHDMAEVFGCVRMTYGPPRPVPWSEVYGVTTFELG